MSYFTIGDLGKEHRTNTYQPEESGKGQRTHHVSDHVPESFLLASILAEPCVHHQEGCFALAFLFAWRGRSEDLLKKGLTLESEALA